jgi:protein-S-isoprenylcysteine O-methyltransferase Ste14
MPHGLPTVALASSGSTLGARGTVLVATAVVAFAVELSSGIARRRGALRRDAGSRCVIAVFFGCGIVLLVRSPGIAPSASIGALWVRFGAGEALLAAGIVLRLSAIRALGRYFTREVMVSADQPVIAAGPYRIVRHPSYTALLLYALGSGVVEGNWLGLGAITLFTLLALVYRIRVEEAALTSVLGERYGAYASHRKRLVPGVW